MYTHWLPYQPTAPTCVPTEGEETPNVAQLVTDIREAIDANNKGEAGETNADFWRGYEYRDWVIQRLAQSPTHSAQEVAERKTIPCPHCGDTLLWSEDRGAHCDGCEDFDPETDLPAQSPGSGEALREAIADAIDDCSDGIGEITSPIDEVADHVFAAIQPFLAQPVTPPLPSGAMVSIKIETDAGLNAEWAIQAADRAMSFCDCAAKDDDFRDRLAAVILKSRENNGHPVTPRWAVDAARELHSSFWNVESAAKMIARHAPPLPKIGDGKDGGESPKTFTEWHDTKTAASDGAMQADAGREEK